MFGGVGRTAIAHVENFCEDTLEFTKIGDGRQKYLWNSHMRGASPHNAATKAAIRKRDSGNIGSKERR